MRAFLGLHIVAPTPPNRHGWAGLLQVLTRAAFWKSLAYNAIVGLVLFILGPSSSRSWLLASSWRQPW